MSYEIILRSVDPNHPEGMWDLMCRRVDGLQLAKAAGSLDVCLAALRTFLETWRPDGG